MKFKELAIVKLAGLLNINLLGIAYRARGIGNSTDFNKNGELHFLGKELPGIIENQLSPTIFDIGQNKGDYTQYILDVFPNAMIHGFEPNKNLSDHLQKRFSEITNVKLNQFGLGTKKEIKRLYTYKNDQWTGHGSIYSKVMTDLHNSDLIESQEIQLGTIEDYCRKNKIQQIDFIKIDVEGNEYEVLIGAGKVLSSIKVIQFEFNEMNIISRTFLKDFYDLLPGYSFFRITQKGLFSLGPYSSSFEIFRIQNIIAVNTN